MIRKRTTLTTTERRQRLFCLLFGCILLGTAWGMVMLRWQYDGVPTGWAGFLGMFFQTKPTLPALWTESAGDILLFLLAFFLLGFSAVGQPFAWLLLLTYGVCMGGTLQTQCSAGGAFVAYDAAVLFCAVSAAAGAGGEEPCGSPAISLPTVSGMSRKSRCITSSGCTAPDSLCLQCFCCCSGSPMGRRSMRR